MKAYRVELILTESGVISLQGLPFQAGESVEIIVLEKSTPSMTELSGQAFPLAGTVLHYEDPLEPATPL